jgi:molecular chaperone GrpE
MAQTQRPEEPDPAESAGVRTDADSAPDARPQSGDKGKGPNGHGADDAERDERWLRALADLDNVRKRCVREIAQARSAERARVAGAFLPVIDNLELALTHADSDPDSIMEGIRAVRDQAIAILAALGYARRDEPGVPFDPAAHEVVTVVDDADVPPGTVVRVVRPGYGDAEHQLRPMAVAVARQRG